eukprot:7390230-Prymnesium_polylepis.1
MPSRLAEPLLDSFSADEAAWHERRPPSRREMELESYLGSPGARASPRTSSHRLLQSVLGFVPRAYVALTLIAVGFALGRAQAPVVEVRRESWITSVGPPQAAVVLEQAPSPLRDAAATRNVQILTDAGTPAHNSTADSPGGSKGEGGATEAGGHGVAGSPTQGGHAGAAEGHAGAAAGH